MINCDFSEIIFTSGGTEVKKRLKNIIKYWLIYHYYIKSNNIVFHSILKYYKQLFKSLENSVPHIIISNIEHDSVRLIAEYLEGENLAG